MAKSHPHRASADLHTEGFYMGNRLEKLKELEATLYAAMEGASVRELPALARQYRETIKEIEEIEGTAGTNDEIGEILAERAADGKPGAVRKGRT